MELPPTLPSTAEGRQEFQPSSTLQERGAQGCSSLVATNPPALYCTVGGRELFDFPGSPQNIKMRLLVSDQCSLDKEYPRLVLEDQARYCCRPITISFWKKWLDSTHNHKFRWSERKEAKVEFLGNLMVI